MPGGGNEQQMKFVRDVKQVMIYDLKVALAKEFNDNVPPSFSDIVTKGEKLMNFRLKIIAFAEESQFGWRAANEFASLLKNSSDSDMKKQEEAEKRALKKIAGEKAKRKKIGGYEKALDRSRRSPSRSIKKEKRSRSRSRNRDKKETRECYKCGKVGHISTNCYSKESKGSKRR